LVFFFFFFFWYIIGLSVAGHDGMIIERETIEVRSSNRLQYLVTWWLDMFATKGGAHKGCEHIITKVLLFTRKEMSDQ